MGESNPYTQFTTEIEHIESYWKAKHAFARAFYAAFKGQMMVLWKKINKDKILRPSVWTDFVESPKLWKIAYDKLMTMSYVTIDMCAFAELAVDGMDALTQERETYSLVPLMQAMVPVSGGESILQTVEVEGKRRYACQQLLKTVLIYFFADVYRNKFTVFFTSHEHMEVDQNTINQPFFLKHHEK